MAFIFNNSTYSEFTGLVRFYCITGLVRLSRIVQNYGRKKVFATLSSVGHSLKMKWKSGNIVRKHMWRVWLLLLTFIELSLKLYLIFTLLLLKGCNVYSGIRQTDLLISRGGGGGPLAPGPLGCVGKVFLEIIAELVVCWFLWLLFTTAPTEPCWLLYWWSGASVRKLDGTKPRTPSSSPMKKPSSSISPYTKITSPVLKVNSTCLHFGEKNIYNIHEYEYSLNFSFSFFNKGHIQSHISDSTVEVYEKRNPQNFTGTADWFDRAFVQCCSHFNLIWSICSVK